jgi:CHAD domain-containing protein
MAVASSDKWITGFSTRDKTTKVAINSVEARLVAVLDCLPLAADESSASPESVHQLRVWTRRANVALRLYRKWIPRQRWAWMKKQLKRVRRAANDARDYDVLIQRLAGVPEDKDAARWLEAIRTNRIQAQGSIADVNDRLSDHKNFQRHLEKLVKSMRSRSEKKAFDTHFGDWAHDQLRRFVLRFFKAVPDAPDDSPALHRFRIRAKELRYAIELLAGAFPEQLQNELYVEICQIQDRLGQINDLSTSTARLREKVRDVRNAKKKKSLQRLMKAEQAQLERCRQEFWHWCSPQMLGQLHNRFNTFLDAPTPAAPLAAEVVLGALIDESESVTWHGDVSAITR